MKLLKLDFPSFNFPSGVWVGVRRKIFAIRGNICGSWWNRFESWGNFALTEFHFSATDHIIRWNPLFIDKYAFHSMIYGSFFLSAHTNILNYVCMHVLILHSHFLCELLRIIKADEIWLVDFFLTELQTLFVNMKVGNKVGFKINHQKIIPQNISISE